MDDRYAAGIFDGEGMVRIAKWKKPNSLHVRYAVYVSIGMAHLPVIQEIQKEYGGSIHMNRHDLRNLRNRIQFNVKWGSREASAFLRRIHPHTIVKKDEIEIALMLQAHINDNPYQSPGRNHMHERKNREQILAYREELYEQITMLKKRSFPPLLRVGP